MPGDLVKQLAPGGIMVLPVGAEGKGLSMVRVIKDQDGTVRQEELLKLKTAPPKKKSVIDTSYMTPPPTRYRTH